MRRIRGSWVYKRTKRKRIREKEVYTEREAAGECFNKRRRREIGKARDEREGGKGKEEEEEKVREFADKS